MKDSLQEAENYTGFHVMTKPRGPICNLDCRYCYYLRKESMYPGSGFRMSDEVLEEFVRQYIESQNTPEVTFAWQGGEPTLMGLEFFRKAVDFQEKYRKPGTRIANAFQTNGTRLDDSWCSFFKDHEFLIGLSVDGPQRLHDAYRVDKGGKPSFNSVMKGFELLKKHEVEFNILTTVHAANASHPLAVYRFVRDTLGVDYLQFIPIIERVQNADGSYSNKVKPHSVTGEQYGRFLIEIFDEWMQRDVGRMFVQIFEVALARWSGMRAGLCVFEETCGNAVAMEHNGDVFSCDHFVEPDYKLGNFMETPLTDLVRSERQARFGLAKRDDLPKVCRECEVRFVCNGGCPKNRFIRTLGGEPGLNYLCAGYKAFFRRINRPMQILASGLKAGYPVGAIMPHLARETAMLKARLEKAGRNETCPCGSGWKYKKCHGQLHSLV